MDKEGTDQWLGECVIDAIVSGSLVHGECADADHVVVQVWSPSAAEQLGALVRELGISL